MSAYKIKLTYTKENEFTNEIKVTKPQDIVDFVNLMEGLKNSINERVLVIALNTKNIITAYSEIASGGINCCNIDIPNIFRFLYTTPANKFILVHNHPSGDPTPSKIDIDMTKRIKEASELMATEFLDHIIIADNDYISIFEYMNKGGK